MAFPAFFEKAPRIKVRDALAAFLGASDDGTMEYQYADAVRVAGHSCPTVAGAYLMARAALKELYGAEIPERGNIEIVMSEGEGEGTTGVIAQIFTLVTGAAAKNGFHGIAGKFVRHGLLTFNGRDSGGAIATFRRSDTGEAVRVGLDVSGVEGSPEMRPLMGKALSPNPKKEDLEAFGKLWQERVEKVLLEHADDENVVLLERI
ncbi:MAG: hypothetical protein LDLANPLL_02376 [Turneriella sp.]|nr:hypothetical protein [Turneriella sp.]